VCGYYRFPLTVRPIIFVRFQRTLVKSLSDQQRLARQLHDELGGLLIGAVMDLALLAPRIAAMGGDSPQKMGRVRQALQSAIELSRRITEQLHPTLLDNVGLSLALRWQLRTICAKSKIKCTEDLPHAEPRLTSDASIALFRSAQEALLIGVERQGVTAIVLAATVDDQMLSIQIVGDGAQLPNEPRALVSVTLESVRHRVRTLGGAVNVEHPPDGGIVLAVKAPIANVIKPR
jgi:signal transduction histidine kinase